mgnify:FL=1
MPRILAISEVSRFYALAFLPIGMIYAHTLILFAVHSHAAFCSLQSQVHETWARFVSSSLGDALRYTGSDCFETFPFAHGWQIDPVLEAVGKDYYEFRAALMVRNDEGLTKTYNRFHDPDEDSADILRLRDLHEAMDRAMLDVYGWTDIPTACEFLLDYEEDEEEASARRKPWRYRWPDDVRDEVLARLLELNAQRAAEEALVSAAANRRGGGRRSSSRERNPDAESLF